MSICPSFSTKSPFCAIFFCGVAAIYRAVDEVEGYPVKSVYSVQDLPDYRSYDYHDCPYCKAGKKVDALVNSFGYSSL